MIASFPALRFFYSFLIFIYHGNVINVPSLVALGPCAVSFFFILSGFGISLGYYQKALLSGFSWKDFVVKRIIRIYPLHLLGLAFWYFLNYKTIQMTGGGQALKLIGNVLLLQSWIPKMSFYFYGNAVSWFLCDLLFFYIVFPFAVRLASEKSRAAVFSCALVLLYLLALPFLNDGYIHAFVYINPLFRFLDFWLGILLYKLYKKMRMKVSEPLVSPDAEIKAVIAQSVSIFLIVASIFLYSEAPEVARYQSLFWIPNAFLLISFSVFDKLGIARLLNHRLFAWLGSISFSFYILHFLGISISNIVLSKFFGELNDVPRTCIQFVFVLAGSAIVHFFFEEPVAKKIKMSKIFSTEKNDS